MQPPHQHSRINLVELKAQIVKKLGPEGFKQYSYYLNKFLSLKLNKVDFNKLCLKILGRDNISLHNQLVRSILKNACTAKVPPPPNKKDEFSKHSAHALQNGSHHSVYQASGSPGLSNGIDMLPNSPRKARSVIRDRRSSGDRRVVLGHQKTNVASHQTSGVRVLENGGMLLMQQLEKSVDNSSFSRSEEDESCHVNSKDRLVRDKGKKAFTNIPLEAPFGVKFGAQSFLPSRYMGTSDVGALLDNFTLREQMEQIAVTHGLEGVTPECANILNHGLDSYLKGIIKSCTEQLVRTRSDLESTKNASVKQLSYKKPLNGVKPGFQHLEQNNMQTLDVQEQQRSQCSVSLQNLRVAMELNPSQLGEDWPRLLERICARSFDE